MFEDIPEFIIADPFRITHKTHKYCCNAIKFTDNGFLLSFQLEKHNLFSRKTKTYADFNFEVLMRYRNSKNQQELNS